MRSSILLMMASFPVLAFFVIFSSYVPSTSSTSSSFTLVSAALRFAISERLSNEQVSR
jgi:hypothetical protein